MATKIPAEVLQQIKTKVSILDVVGEHVVLRKSGANHTGLCPFHSERTPSFSVSENKGLFHCYGCKAGGDLFQFMMQLHGLSFMEAVQDLASRAGVTLQSLNAQDLQRATDQQKKRDTALKLNRFVAAFYHQSLRQSENAKTYFEARGVPEEIQELFYLGSTPDLPSGDGLSLHLEKSKAPLALASELGLIKKQTHGWLDMFRERYVFPVMDTRGRVVGFGGRVRSNAMPKYLNSSESLLFQKSKLLYGIFQAARFIRETAEAVVVEGYFDVLTLHAKGFQNVVATCGTQLSEDHLKIISRFAPKVVLLFDADKAGQMATLKSMETGLRLGQVLYTATIPTGKDPDEVALENPDLLRRAIAEAKPVLDMEIEKWVEKAQAGPEAKSQAVKQIGQWLGMFEDPVGRQVRVDDLSRRLGVSKSVLMGAPDVSRIVPVSKRPARAQPVPRTDLVALKALLRATCLQGERSVIWKNLWAETLAKLPSKSEWTDIFEHSELRDFTYTHREKFASPITLESWLTSQSDEGVEVESLWISKIRGFFAEISMETGQVPEGKTKIDDPDLLLRVRSELSRSLEKAWARFSQRLLVDIKFAEEQRDSDKQSNLLKDYLDAQKKMKEFRCFIV